MIKKQTLGTLLFFLVPILYSQIGFLVDGFFLILYLFFFSFLIPVMIQVFSKRGFEPPYLRSIISFIFINLIGSCIFIWFVLRSLNIRF